MRTALAVLVMVLAGCAATPAEQAAQDDETCIDYGFAHRTTDYAACRLHVAQSREDRDNMTRAALFVGRPQPRY